MPQFTHLHVHSHFSLLDGLAKIDQLLDRAKELGMRALALTDHGNLYGAVEFYKKAKEKGIKPILGAEIYLAFESLEQKRPKVDDAIYHMVLLVKNQEGYQNLVKILTHAHLQGFYYKPRVDEAFLSRHSAGLIALSGCLNGRIPKALLSKNPKEAERLTARYQEIFGKRNFYLELQRHPNIPEQEVVNTGLLKLSKKLDIPVVATADSHYLQPEDAQAQDVLMLINTGSRPDDPERLTLSADDFSLKSSEEMASLFSDVPEAISNTQTIAEQCSLELEVGVTKLPVFPLPEGKQADEYLRELCLQGLGDKPEFQDNPEVMERLDFELGVIKQTGFAPYFLIVQDFVKWAKERRIVVGPGRGSVGGSLVAYLLKITNINPLQHNLLFERFLNPERVSLPDIDLDFADYRRDEVIQYVADKYGSDRVAQIITFGTMAARAVVRDVGRALGYEYSYCDRAAKMIPFSHSLDQALENVEEFRELYEQDPRAKRLIDLAKKLEGVARHASTHACGVVIASQPLNTVVPLQHPTQNDQNIVTQYEMHSIEDLGLLKMDFLGLKNLSIIEETLKRIYAIYGKNIDIDRIPQDDPAVYKLFQEAKTIGVFQTESAGMQRYLKELQPTEFEDIIAMIALYRPGPMELIPEYIARKHGKKKISYLHAKLEPILKSTQGICIYQEELMQIARDLAGFSLAEADVLRKAVGKKIRSLLLEQKEKFVSGMVKNGIEQKIASQLWEWVLPFARYGFNKCVTGNTKIIESKSGKLVRIADVFEGKVNVAQTFSLNDRFGVELRKVLDVWPNGKKEVFELKTKSGRTIEATANHPFLTWRGWRNLEDVRKGEWVAAPRKLPEPEQPMTVSDYKLGLLGYLLAEGNFCHPHGFYFYSNSKDEVQDYLSCLRQFENTKGTIDVSKKAVAVYAKRKNTQLPSEAVEWIEALGLKYKKAPQKFIPEFVYQLSNAQLAILIGKMFQGDGCIHFDGKDAQVFYATSSEAVAKGLLHLLLRFGVLSTIHTKKFRYRDGHKVGYTVNISRYDNLEKFFQYIAPHLLENKARVVQKIQRTYPAILEKLPARGSKDIVPALLIGPLVRTAVLEAKMTQREAGALGGFSDRLFASDPRKTGYLRETVARIATTLHSEDLKRHAESDIFWDKVVSITPRGKKQTYDLTIEGTHNFIANDIFVHNSHSAAYATIAYQTAWLKTHYPVEFMSALLTAERNDVERIAFLIEETRKMDIEVLPPDLNESFSHFSVVPQKNQVRFGLLAIKNVGAGIVEAIIEERKANGPYVSIQDFVSRVNSKDLNKKALESLLKAGVFDYFEERNTLLHNLERLLEIAREHHKLSNGVQRSLFASTVNNDSRITLEKAEPAPEQIRLQWEKELLGLYVSSHPLERIKNILHKRAYTIERITGEKHERLPGTPVHQAHLRIGGIISSVKRIITKAGKPMLFLGLEDLTDRIEVVVFPSVIEKYPAAIQENKIVLVAGRLNTYKGTRKFIAEEIEELQPTP